GDSASAPSVNVTTPAPAETSGPAPPSHQATNPHNPAIADTDSRADPNATETVRLRCSHGWLFGPPPEDTCPTAPLVGAAAEQHFEGGI
ncbi:MAG: hypothetical protein MUQ30_13890, partial [Anaerolineae bacterium]|nr:hypothetical protein [Anaerolineae bacterium]